MTSPELTVIEKCQQYKMVLNAAGASVVRISATVALIGLFKGATSGASYVYLYIFAVVTSTLGMCMFLLIILPVIWNAKHRLHPAFISFTAMLTLGGCSYIGGLALNGHPIYLNETQAMMMILGFLYGAAIGLEMHKQEQKIEHNGPVTATPT